MRAITVGEAAKILGVSRKKVLALIKQQQLRARCENFRWLVDADSVAKIAPQKPRRAARLHAAVGKAEGGRLISTRRAAQLLGVTPRMVRNYIQDGLLRAYLDPYLSEYRIRYEDLEEFARKYFPMRSLFRNPLGEYKGYVTVAEAARRLGIKIFRMYGILKRGEIATMRVGRRWLVELRSLEEYKHNGGVTSV